MGDPSEEERLAAARRALAGIKGRAPKPPTELRKAASEDEPNMLEALVNAMKQGAGPSAVLEPDGYHLLATVREEGPMTKDVPYQRIEALQRALKRCRADCAETGYLDDQTVAAIKKFQAGKGLEATGVFDAKALDAMDRHLGLDKKDEGGAGGGQGDADADANFFQMPRSTAGQHVLPETGNKFLDEVAPGAVKGMHQFGVPASVSMAMAVLESSWGERLPAKDAKNVFSLKGKGPAGSAYFREDGSPGGSTEYRRYATLAESVVDHAKLLAASYPAPMSHRGHADNFAAALAGSYSADTRYGALLTRIMKQFDLYRFDRIRPEQE